MAAARSNKAQLYAYFGNKEKLFDTIFFGSLERIVNVVPIDADDLADWAVRLYDEYLRRPDLIRLATWARLERRPAGHLVDDHDRMDDRKLRAIAEAQAAGRVREGDPFDVMAMVIAMSMAWSPVSNVYAATAEESPEVHERRRALLRECVRRAVVAE
ncbi:hypothetical protein GCM10009727_41330 [Actinomadura napierensis]|uniref:HTH-type transcriptional repressor Sco4008 C-terminal domain-containing protein n=1 Tax=Actinomadura napierensis TaxID=267854 RepID=A0ABN2ZIR8_9ACTN